jgi:hypothetical protein
MSNHVWKSHLTSSGLTVQICRRCQLKRSKLKTDTQWWYNEGDTFEADGTTTCPWFENPPDCSLRVMEKALK